MAVVDRVTILISQLLLSRARRRHGGREGDELYLEWLSEVRNVLADTARCSKARTIAGVLRFAASQTPVSAEAAGAARVISMRIPRCLAVVSLCFCVVFATFTGVATALAGVAPLMPLDGLSSSLFEYVQMCFVFAVYTVASVFLASLFAGAVPWWRSVVNAVEVLIAAIAAVALTFAVALMVVGLRDTPDLIASGLSFAWLSIGCAGGVGNLHLIARALSRMSEALAHGSTEVGARGYVEFKEAMP